MVFRVGRIRLGDVICYEVGFDGLVSSEVRAGANLLAMQTNDASFEVDGQRGETLQQLAMARMRAVESDRAVVVASTTGVSAVIAPGRAAARPYRHLAAGRTGRPGATAEPAHPGRPAGRLAEAVIILLTLAAFGWAVTGSVCRWRASRRTPSAVGASLTAAWSADVRSAAWRGPPFPPAAAGWYWSRQVPGLDFTVALVVAHAGGPLWYAVDLTNGPADDAAFDLAQPTRRACRPAGQLAYRRHAMRDGGEPAAGHRARLPPGGRADPSGFAAMACDEILVHTYDAGTGLGEDFRPGPELAARVRGCSPGASLCRIPGRRCCPRTAGSTCPGCPARRAGNGTARRWPSGTARSASGRCLADPPIRRCCPGGHGSQGAWPAAGAGAMVRLCGWK